VTRSVKTQLIVFEQTSTIYPDMSVSRASTATLAYNEPPEPYVHHHQRNSEPSPEKVPRNLLDKDVSKAPSKRLIIAVDFGTTYSSISYVALEEGESGQYLDPSRVRSIENYPEDWNVVGDGMKCAVPTEVMYPLDRFFREKEDNAAAENDGHQLDMLPDDIPRARGGAAFYNGNDDLAVFGHNSDSDADRMSVDEDEGNTFRWGYEVHEVWGLQSTHLNPKNQALARFKLLLDESEKTKEIRRMLKPTLDELKRRRIIRRPEDVIVDFLTSLLRHARSELVRQGFDESYRHEMVLCVPAIWSQKACRHMQSAMGKAMRRAGLGGVDSRNNSVDNLFIVSEPEAAAAYVLAADPNISVRYYPFPPHYS